MEFPSMKDMRFALALELLLALEARFAPQVTSRDTEARQKLSSRSYRMRPSETVAAYQSRFEAILTDVESPSDPEKIFWFHSGLSDSLIGDPADGCSECAYFYPSCIFPECTGFGSRDG
ncbi:hypothetical protein Vafri_7901, partial [Volvox africanus]